MKLDHVSMMYQGQRVQRGATTYMSNFLVTFMEERLLFTGMIQSVKISGNLLRETVCSGNAYGLKFLI